MNVNIIFDRVKALKEQKGGTIVLRPDSGDPVEQVALRCLEEYRACRKKESIHENAAILNILKTYWLFVVARLVAHLQSRCFPRRSLRDLKLRTRCSAIQ